MAKVKPVKVTMKTYEQIQAELNHPERCIDTVHQGNWHSSRCMKRGKVQREGKWFCTVHDPVRRREKQYASYEAYISKSAAQRAIREQSERDESVGKYLRENDLDRYTAILTHMEAKRVNSD